MEETAAGAANRMSHGWASRVQQHRKMVIVSDGETGFISEVIAEPVCPFCSGTEHD
jgi:hypothetical protein